MKKNNQNYLSYLARLSTKVSVWLWKCWVVLWLTNAALPKLAPETNTQVFALLLGNLAKGFSGTQWQSTNGTIIVFFVIELL